MGIITQRSRLPLLGVPLRRSAWQVADVARPADRVRFETITHLDEMVALGPEWADLFARAGKPQQAFQAFDWLHLWAQLYLDRTTRLTIVTGRRDRQLVLVWPLVVTRHCGVRVLSGMGEPLSQYCDALIADDLDTSSMSAAFDYAMSLKADVVALRRVRDDAAIAPILRQRFAPAHRAAAPYVDLAGLRDAAAFEARFPGKVRASRRRRRRRLEEIGPLTFVAHGPSPEAMALVETALHFKRAWAEKAGILSPALRDPRFEQFFRSAADPASHVAGLRVSALRRGDDIVGVEMSLACGGCLFGHVLAPKPGDAQLGLGGILAEMTILDALAAGYTSVDLLPPADAYKLDWTANVQGVSDYAVPLTLKGAIYDRLWLRFGRERAKQLARRLRPSIANLSRRLRLRGRVMPTSSSALFLPGK